MTRKEADTAIKITAQSLHELRQCLLDTTRIKPSMFLDGMDSASGLSEKAMMHVGLVVLRQLQQDGDLDGLSHDGANGDDDDAEKSKKSTNT